MRQRVNVGRPLACWLAATALTALGGCSEDARVAGQLERLGRATEAVTNAGYVDADTRPWAAFLRMEFFNGETHYCSGALIGPTQVLTASHCLVCTSHVTVWLVGVTGYELEDIDPQFPNIFESWESASLATQPEAFSTFDRSHCLRPTDEWQGELNANMAASAGADLGVVHLARAPSVPHANVLLTPPYGFSPVQDLFGTVVKIIGRGPGEAGHLADLHYMREGVTGVDSYWNMWLDVPTGCGTWPSGPFFIATDPDSERPA